MKQRSRWVGRWPKTRSAQRADRRTGSRASPGETRHSVFTPGLRAIAARNAASADSADSLRSRGSVSSMIGPAAARTSRGRLTSTVVSSYADGVAALREITERGSARGYGWAG
ncbi:MAG: hypothetical protein P8Y27_02345 [Chromatiaceae bacterium]|jgi:hypothetical protein